MQQFKKSEPLKLLLCETCQATGFVKLQKCKECQSMAFGMSRRELWLYWDFSLTRYNLALQKARRILKRVRMVTTFVFWFNAWIWSGFIIFKQDKFSLLVDPKLWPLFFKGINNWAEFLFWLGVLSILYLWYQIIRKKELIGKMETFKHDYQHREKKEDAVIESWAQAKKFPVRKRFNVASAFTEEALTALAKSYGLADNMRVKELKPEHLFYALLSFNRIGNIFIRLGIPASSLQKELKHIFPETDKQKAYAGVSPTVSTDIHQMIFQAYEEAYLARQEYVSVTELLIVVLRATPALQYMLFDFDISERQLTNVIEWAKMRERFHHQYLKMQKAINHHSKYGMDRAMTALATPYLNSFSSDITMMAHFGQLEECVARTAEIDQIFQVIDGGQNNVILVGEHGVGKKTIVEGIAQSMISGDVPNKLKDKRLIRLSSSALLAGTSPEGAVERLQSIMQEISRARNVILFINNLHELVGVSVGESGSLDMADTIAEFLRSERVLTIATTTTEDYAGRFAGSSLKDVFAKVNIAEMDEDQAIQVLESRVGSLEYKQNVFFSYSAIEKAVEFSMKFLHDTVLPGNALEIITEAAALTHNTKGANSLVTKEEVATIITEKTKIPLSAISSNESEKLMHLEEEMRKRVIGQEEGVSAVANALRRARAEIRSGKRPIASFLFLGPTGVGKTELAKTIADIYFGGEDRMIRLDMSEYQDKSSIYRLIGMPGEKASGVLTEAIRQNPFSLVLLDEMEKADPDILNLFLQVMDDGRLSDSTGHVYDFTNVIIIATSNAGTAFVQEQNRNGVPHEKVLNQLLHGELKQYYRPEFLNRFDGVVLFNDLTRDGIKQIANQMFLKLAKNIEEKGVTLVATDDALEFLVEVGFDPEFGARPMRRALQEKVENKLAELFLAGKLRRGSTVTVRAGGKMTVE
jgi:ATP-dependent Clp protease ATP-binding subunit ClpA